MIETEVPHQFEVALKDHAIRRLAIPEPDVQTRSGCRGQVSAVWMPGKQSHVFGVRQDGREALFDQIPQKDVGRCRHRQHLTIGPECERAKIAGQRQRVRSEAPS